MENNINCPNCGALMQKGSKVCSSCGFVLHEEHHSETSFENICNEVEIALSQLKQNHQFYALDSLKKQYFIILPAFFFLSLAILLFSNHDSELNVVVVPIMLLFLVLSYISIRFKIKNQRNKINLSNIKSNLKQNISNLEKFYSNDPSVKRLIKDYQQELEYLNKMRKRDILNAITGYGLIIAIMVLLIWIMPWDDDYTVERKMENRAFKQLQPLEKFEYKLNSLHTKINGNLSDYLELVSQTANVKIKADYDNVILYFESLQFRVKKGIPSQLKLDRWNFSFHVYLLDEKQLSIFPEYELDYDVMKQLDKDLKTGKKQVQVKATICQIPAKTRLMRHVLKSSLTSEIQKARWFVISGFILE